MTYRKNGILASNLNGRLQTQPQGHATRNTLLTENIENLNLFHLWVLCAPQSVIMEENVDKSRDSRAARRRQIIQKTRRNQYKQYAEQRMLRLGDEIAFAKTIILPFPRRRKPKDSFNDWNKPSSPWSIGTLCSYGNHKMGALFRDSVKEPVIDLGTCPQKDALWFIGVREREKACTGFCPTPR